MIRLFNATDPALVEYQQHKDRKLIDRMMRKAPVQVRVMQQLRFDLWRHGLYTRIISIGTTGSCYIGFVDQRMGKIRVGDHPERKKYGYRWQVRLDLKVSYMNEDKGHPRYFYPAADLEKVVGHMARYLTAIRRRT